MFNNKFRTHHFAPGPMDYMKNKIEKLRENLVVNEQPTRVESSNPLVDQIPNQATADSLHSEMRDCTDDEMSSGTGGSDLLSLQDSPLLPLFSKDAYRLDSPTTNTTKRVLSIVRQPIFILLATALVYIVSSTALAILDRFSMYQATYKFPYPLSHLFFQLISCEVAIILIMLITRILLHLRPDMKGSMPLVENLAIDLTNLKTFSSVSMSYLVASAALVYCLNYIPMHHVVLVLSPTMLCQLALSKYFSPDNTQSIYTAVSCLCLMSGQAIAALASSGSGMPGINLQGLLAGLVASLAFPIHNCLVKKNLAKVNHNALQMLHYIVVGALLMTMPLLLISGEVFDVFTNCYFLDEAGFWVMLLVLGLLGILTSISQFLLLTFTSPLTLVVLSFAKTALIQVPFAGWLNRLPLAWFNYFGLILSLVSVCGYLYLINVRRPKFGLHWRA
ncbi:protein of unknown function [Taphrina deformans PYCC 5710]|uniref:GDP-mannose transporter n=1 Tax=Taphrina deformans (strain PYCC 5710 / ATCC 11124 / CBS 356.35 / IMI 108563 / JCM 9778 / NBRC 8474) TaxID=1097556 RepID=R4XHP4_TAPDE|nr:protein of unknown function [Taphrina deformans PYCC 5710]|eukprot:CCG82937.1 protein of unknown function [Taphrina deformans PYCC 5710]